VKAPLESGLEFGFVIVTVTADVPPVSIVAGVKLFETVGAAELTVRLAVLETGPAGV
jgi:hypothetical protein